MVKLNGLNSWRNYRSEGMVKKRGAKRRPWNKGLEVGKKARSRQLK